MAPSYKTLWQEAQQEIGQREDRIRSLEVKIRNLRRMIDQLAAALGGSRDGRGGDRIVDLAGIARHLGVERYTPQQWRQRDLLPPVDFPEIREPLWYASTIREKFAEPTGRIWYDQPPTAEELSPAA